MTSAAAVVVPTHRSVPTDDDLRSLQQVTGVLSRHDVHLVVPGELDVAAYRERFPTLTVTRVPEQFFGSVAAHNRMLMSADFYERFEHYDFLLIHHTDAFVFRDELDAWCDRDYDYVGPPWFEGFEAAAPDAPLIGVGNGGFSLRKVSTFLSITRRLRIAEQHGLVNRLPTKVRLVLRRTLLPAARVVRAPRPMYERMFAAISARFAGAEDVFWGLRVSVDLPGFRVIDPRQAVAFAFEVHPARLLEMNGQRLPFGCHGWTKYDRAFWEPILDRTSSASAS